MGQRILPATLLLALGVVAWQEQRRGQWPPRPHLFVGLGLAFTVLAMLALASPGLAAAFGVAVNVGLLVRPQLLGASGAGKPSPAQATAPATSAQGAR